MNTNPYIAYNNGQPFPGQNAVHSPAGIITNYGLTVVKVKLNKKRTKITMTWNKQHPVTTALNAEYCLQHAASKYMYMVHGRRNLKASNMVWMDGNTVAVALAY